MNVHAETSVQAVFRFYLAKSKLILNAQCAQCTIHRYGKIWAWIIFVITAHNNEDMMRRNAVIILLFFNSYEQRIRNGK